MGTITVNGGGAQVVRYSTKSGRWSNRIPYNGSEQLEIDDSGDQVSVHFCFFTCGWPDAGPCDVLPGDVVTTTAGLWNGIEVAVFRGNKKVCDKWTGD